MGVDPIALEGHVFHELSMIIDVSGPAVFDSGSISPSHVAEDLVGISGLTGMAPKPIDPADTILIQTFMAKHGLARLFIFGDTVPDAMRGLARLIPFGATTTPHGKRYAREVPDVLSAYPTKPPAASPDGHVGNLELPLNMPDVDRFGEPDVGEEEVVISLADIYDNRMAIQGGWMSLAEAKHSRLRWDPLEKCYRKAIPDSQKLPVEGKLPDRHCLNPECLLPIDEDAHHNVMYCSEAHRERAKELRRRDRVRHGKPTSKQADQIPFTGMNLHSSVISETISIY
jgi:hypothetical protein